jgi:phospholipase C
MNKKLICATPIAIAAALSLYACGDSEISDPDITAIKNVVVIYAENRSFDNLYGNFPGANGLQNVTASNSTQVDRDHAAASVERSDANRRDARRDASDDGESAE